MPTANNSRITLELEAGADPIRGSIEHPDGSSQPFWGWLELMEELRRVAADEPSGGLGQNWRTLGRNSTMREPSGGNHTTTEGQP